MVGVERDWFPSLGAATAAGPAATSWVPTEPGFFIFVHSAVWSIPFSGRAVYREMRSRGGGDVLFSRRACAPRAPCTDCNSVVRRRRRRNRIRRDGRESENLVNATRVI